MAWNCKNWFNSHAQKIYSVKTLLHAISYNEGFVFEMQLLKNEISFYWSFEHKQENVSFLP